MRSLYRHFVKLGGLYLTGAEVKDYKENPDTKVTVRVKNTADVDNDLIFDGSRIVLCTNAYTNVVSK
jgi:anaerobic glycerol-3-phosphate dehydrogenase